MSFTNRQSGGGTTIIKMFSDELWRQGSLYSLEKSAHIFSPHSSSWETHTTQGIRTDGKVWERDTCKSRSGVSPINLLLTDYQKPSIDTKQLILSTCLNRGHFYASQSNYLILEA